MAHTVREGLVSEIRRGRVVAVVGAGVAIAASGGKPTAGWIGLLRDGIKRIEALNRAPNAGWAKRQYAILDEASAGECDITDLLGVAEQIGNRLGFPNDGEWRRWLRETVGALTPAAQPRLLKAIAALGIPIVTTNYDGLLEEATGHPPLTWTQTDDIARFLRREQNGIWHLHGYWQEPQTVVLGIRDYTRIVAADTAQHLQRVLPTINGLLYIGCGTGLEDPNFRALRAWIRNVLPSTDHRHIRLACDADVATLQRDHPSEERTIVLGYGATFDELAPFLEALARDASLTESKMIGIPRPERSFPRGNGAKSPEIRTPDPLEPKIQLLGRERELTHLEELYKTPLPPVVCVHGPEGSGKTYLISTLAKKISALEASNIWPFWYSFPSREAETSPDIGSSAFFIDALHAFGFPDPLPDTEELRCNALLSLVKSRHSLLILDSVENIQDLMEPHDKITSDENTTTYGRIKDTQLKRFLYELAKTPHKQCMVVICSRHPLIDLQDLIDSHGYEEIELLPLHAKAGAEILRQMKVHGDAQHFANEQAVLEDLSIILCGNPVIILFTGGFILDKFDGNAQRWKNESSAFYSTVPRELIKKILALHDKNLSNEQRAFLRLLGLFGRAMADEDFRVLLESKAGERLKGLLERQLDEMFEMLSTYNLLIPKRQYRKKWDKWDTHTVVRQYFGAQLRQKCPDQWTDAHVSLFKYYRHVADSFPKNPDLSDLERMFGVVRHGCLAGQYADAYEFYRQKIAKDWDGYDTEEWGMVSDALNAISGFFIDESFEGPVEGLGQIDIAWLLARASYCLESQGNFKESAITRERSNAEYHSLYDDATKGSYVAFERARDGANGSEELAGIRMRLGELWLAEANARHAVLWADLAAQCADQSREAGTWQEAGEDGKEVPPWLRQCSTLSALGAVLHWQGKLEKAVEVFERARNIYADHEKKWVWHSEAGVRYCALRLDRANSEHEFDEILSYTNEILKWSGTPHINGIHLMIKGRVLIELERFRDAEITADKSISLIQDSHKLQFLCDSLLVRAEARRLSGEVSAARDDVEEALSISRDGGITPYLANGYLLSAHIALDMKDGARAKKDLDNACIYIRPEYNQDCYRLRLAELYLLKARLDYFKSARHETISRSLDDAQKYITKTGFLRLNRKMQLYREGRWER